MIVPMRTYSISLILRRLLPKFLATGLVLLMPLVAHAADVEVVEKVRKDGSIDYYFSNHYPLHIKVRYSVTGVKTAKSRGTKTEVRTLEKSEKMVYIDNSDLSTRPRVIECQLVQ
jgi:hypothetical protein